jgi:hypothetical protein
VEPLIAALRDGDSSVRSIAVSALGQIDTVEQLKQLIQNPTVDIYEPELFSRARKLVIQFSNKKELFSKDMKSKEALIPVYPKRVITSLMIPIKKIFDEFNYDWDGEYIDFSH